MQLLAGLCDLIDEFTRQCLEHGNILHDVVALRYAPGAVVQVLARGAGAGIQHRNALAHHLLVPQRRAEGLARAHPVQRQPQRLRAVTNGHGTECYALSLKVLHHGAKAAVLFAKQVGRGDAAVIETQLGGV